MEFQMSSVTNSSEAASQQYIRGLVYGPPGSLKSASSVTLSEYCPADWTHVKLVTPPKRELVHLKDMLWLAFDAQALFGFQQLGVSAPIIDLSQVPGAGLNAKIDEALRDIAAEVAAGRTKSVVVDTISRGDGAMTSMLTDMGLANGDDTFTLYRELAQRHFKLHMKLSTLPINLLYLSHAKTGAEATTTSKSQTVQTAAQTASKKRLASGTVEVNADITGKSLNLYRGDGSFVFNCRRAKKLVDGKPVDGYWFFNGDDRVDGKSRLIIPDGGIAADWREVRKLMGLPQKSVDTPTSL